MKYKIEDVKAYCMSIMQKAGLDVNEAENVVNSLIAADMRGVSSHGVTRLRTYAKRVLTGVVKAGAEPKIIMESPAALTIDGCNGNGSYIGIQVMDMCIERAKTNGSCFATVYNGNHFGIGAFFTMHAAGNGMIGVAMSNAPASVVPMGGKKPMLGTNPLSIAVPAGKYPPLVLDMATSVVAQGKVILADKEGKSIPDSWAVDENGVPTTDPKAALKGAMLPFGGPKGYAIAFIIDILCSTLSGAYNSRGINNFWNDFKNPQNLGYFMGVWNIESFLPREIYNERIDAMFDEMKACPPAPGSKEVFIPGEIEHRLSEAAKKDGIELGTGTVGDLVKLAEEYGVPHPFGA